MTEGEKENYLQSNSFPPFLLPPSPPPQNKTRTHRLSNPSRPNLTPPTTTKHSIIHWSFDTTSHKSNSVPFPPPWGNMSHRGV